MKQAFVKDSDVQIVGIKQMTPGCAAISGFNDDGSPEYAGGTTMYWDNQKDMPGPDGGTIYICEDGEEHTAAEIEFREAASEA